jgi:hypothetical protein
MVFAGVRLLGAVDSATDRKLIFEVLLRGVDLVLVHVSERYGRDLRPRHNHLAAQ